MISTAVILFKCWLESTTFCGRVWVFINRAVVMTIQSKKYSTLLYVVAKSPHRLNHYSIQVTRIIRTITKS